MIDVVLSLMIVVSFLGAIVLHEWSHAQMASWLGDATPRLEGRLRLRLNSHIDPVGLLVCIVLAFAPAAAVGGLGWGRPVKPDPWKLRFGPNTGVLIVACTGLIFSLLLGLLTMVVVRLLLPVLGQNVVGVRLLQLLTVFAVVNISLFLLNLIPLYPLDGYQILYTLLPSRQAVSFARSATYGPFILVIVFFFLPFLAQLTHESTFALFHIGHYIWLWANDIASLVWIGSPISSSISALAAGFTV